MTSYDDLDTVLGLMTLDRDSDGYAVLHDYNINGRYSLFIDNLAIPRAGLAIHKIYHGSAVVLSGYMDDPSVIRQPTGYLQTKIGIMFWQNKEWFISIDQLHELLVAHGFNPSDVEQKLEAMGGLSR